jgi:hypothetical protein
MTEEAGSFWAAAKVIRAGIFKLPGPRAKWNYTSLKGEKCRLRLNADDVRLRADNIHLEKPLHSLERWVGTKFLFKTRSNFVLVTTDGTLPSQNPDLPEVREVTDEEAKTIFSRLPNKHAVNGLFYWDFPDKRSRVPKPFREFLPLVDVLKKHERKNP